MTNFLKKVLKKCLCRRPEEGHEEEEAQEELRLAQEPPRLPRTLPQSETAAMMAVFDSINNYHLVRVDERFVVRW